MAESVGTRWAAYALPGIAAGRVGEEEKRGREKEKGGKGQRKERGGIGEFTFVN